MILFPASYPLEILSYDVLGSFPITTSGAKAVLVVCDKFTKWVELFPLADCRAETIADILWEQVFCRFGFPEKLLSDFGGNVHNNRLIQRLCERSNVSKISTSPYHQATDGQCERMNKYVLSLLRVYTEQNAHSDWDKFLPGIAFAYRVTMQSSMGTSPFSLMFLRQPNIPAKILYGPKSEIERDRKEYLVEQTARMRSTYDAALAVQDRTDKYKKAYFDARQIDVEYELGDLVWLYTPKTKPGLSKKLSPKNSGPFEVTAKHSPVSYNITDAQGKTQRVHIQRLIPCYLKPGARWEKLEIPKPPVDDDMFEISEPEILKERDEVNILKKRVSPDTHEVEYLVQSGVLQDWVNGGALPQKAIRAFLKKSRTARARRDRA